MAIAKSAGASTHPCLTPDVVQKRSDSSSPSRTREPVLAPESIKVNKGEKLIPTLNDKTKYIVRHENLKLYENLGLNITNIH